MDHDTSLGRIHGARGSVSVNLKFFLLFSSLFARRFVVHVSAESRRIVREKPFNWNVSAFSSREENSARFEPRFTERTLSF